MPTIAEIEAQRRADLLDMELSAADMQSKLLAGEKVPLEDLKAFILLAHKSHEAIRKERNKAEEKAVKPAPRTDVDFF